MRWVFAFLLLIGCDRRPVVDDTAGGRLEAVALARGLVVDATKVSLVGTWTSDTDRVCIVPQPGGLQMGASVDYGEGQTCSATGKVDRTGERLSIAFGSCRFEATFDGERIVFPADMPAACAASCTGRASLATLTVERQSASPVDATAMKAADGKMLCAPS